MGHEGHLQGDLLQQYLDGELEAAECGRLESHLTTCQECRAELAALRQLFAALEELAPAPALLPAVLARIAAGREKAAGRRRSRWLLPALQCAAAVALFVWAVTRPLAYWASARDRLSGLLSRAWTAVSNALGGPLSSLSAWLAAQWALVRGWLDAAFATRLPAWSDLRLSPVQIVVLGAVAAVLWLVGNALLLRRGWAKARNS